MVASIKSTCQVVIENYQYIKCLDSWTINPVFVLADEALHADIAFSEELRKALSAKPKLLLSTGTVSDWCLRRQNDEKPSLGPTSRHSVFLLFLVWFRMLKNSIKSAKCIQGVALQAIEGSRRVFASGVLLREVANLSNFIPSAWLVKIQGLTNETGYQTTRMGYHWLLTAGVEPNFQGTFGVQVRVTSRDINQKGYLAHGPLAVGSQREIQHWARSWRKCAWWTTPKLLCSMRPMGSRLWRGAPPKLLSTCVGRGDGCSCRRYPIFASIRALHYRPLRNPTE